MSLRSIFYVKGLALNGPLESQGQHINPVSFLSQFIDRKKQILTNQQLLSELCSMSTDFHVQPHAS